MLVPKIDDNEPYRFFIDDHNPLRLVLATSAMLDATEPMEPLWQREAGDARSFLALSRWIFLRRDRWPEWGQLAENLGRKFINQHMRKRMELEPICENVGASVASKDHPDEVVFYDNFHGPQGLFAEPIATHRFATPSARAQFFEWLYTDENILVLNNLAEIAYLHGTVALGEMLDKLAAHQGATNRAGRRRRPKAA